MFLTGAPPEQVAKLVKIIQDFMEKLSGVKFGAVVSIEGLPIAHYPQTLPGDLDETRIAAMTAAILSLGERAMMETGQGELVRISVEGNDGYLVSVSAGSRAVLTVSANRDLKLGLIFHDLKEAARLIAEILE